MWLRSGFRPPRHAKSPCFDVTTALDLPKFLLLLRRGGCHAHTPRNAQLCLSSAVVQLVDKRPTSGAVYPHPYTQRHGSYYPHKRGYRLQGSAVDQ